MPWLSAKWRTAVLVCLACVVEGADMAVLPSVYLFIARSLRASPSQLGLMTLCRALMQALSSPIRCDASCRKIMNLNMQTVLLASILFRVSQASLKLDS
jgi:hypothetical protein